MGPPHELAIARAIRRYRNEQSQRGSNPCLHLERAERIMAARLSQSQGMSFLRAQSANLDDQ